jgi:hypothetical protein
MGKGAVMPILFGDPRGTGALDPTRRGRVEEQKGEPPIPKEEPKAAPMEDLKQLGYSFSKHKIRAEYKDEEGRLWGEIRVGENKRYIPIRDVYRHGPSGKEYAVADNGTVFSYPTEEEEKEGSIWTTLLDVIGRIGGAQESTKWEGLKEGVDFSDVEALLGDPRLKAMYGGAKGFIKGITSEYGKEATTFSDFFKSVSGQNIQTYMDKLAEQQIEGGGFAGEHGVELGSGKWEKPTQADREKAAQFIREHGKTVVDMVMDLGTAYGIGSTLPKLRMGKDFLFEVGKEDEAAELGAALSKERENLISTLKVARDSKKLREAGEQYRKNVDNVVRQAVKRAKKESPTFEATKDVAETSEDAIRRGVDSDAVKYEELAAEDELSAIAARQNDPAGRFAQLEKQFPAEEQEVDFMAKLRKIAEEEKAAKATPEAKPKPKERKLTPAMKAKLEADRQMDEFLNKQARGKVSDEWDGFQIREAPDINFESSGLQTAYETIAKQAKKLFGTERVKMKHLVEQSEDVFPLVKEMFDEAYSRTMYNLNLRRVIGEEAQIKGFRLTRKSKGHNWKLTRKGTARTEEFKNLNEVAKRLGLGDDAQKYADEVAKFQIDIEAHEAAKLFNEWAFPEGVQNLNIRRLKKGVDKLQKRLEKPSKKGLHFFDYNIWSPEAVLGRTPTGKKFFNTLRNARDDADIMIGTDYSRLLKALDRNGISDNNQEILGQIRRALDKGEMPTNRKAQKAALEIRRLLDDIYGRARGANIKTAEYRGDYYPHVFLSKDALKRGPKRKEVLEASVAEGKFKSMKEAEDALDGFIARLEGNKTDDRFIKWLARKNGMSLQEARRYYENQMAKYYSPESGSLVNRRVADIPWYDRNPLAALGHYIGAANRHISNSKHGLTSGSWRKRMLDRIEAEGGNVYNADMLLKKYVRPWDYTNKSRAIRFALGYNAVTKLNPLTSLLNMSQNLATTLRTDMRSMVRGVLKMDPNYGREVGAISQRTLGDISELHAGRGKLASKYMGAIGFKTSEKILRTMAANAGREYAQRMARMLLDGKAVKKASRQLRSIGLDPDEIMKRGRLTEEEMKRAAKQVSDQTQFRGDVLDLPTGWVGPYGRLLTQFNTFIYRQAKLIKDQVFKEAARGNFRPLIFLGSAYPAAGVTYDTLVNQVLLGKDAPEGALDWYFRGLTAIGGLGMLDSIMTSMKYGKTSMYEQVAGPSVSEAVDAAQATYRILNGDDPTPWKTMKKAVMRRTPFLSPWGRRLAREDRGGFQGYEGFEGFEEFGSY